MFTFIWFTFKIYNQWRNNNNLTYKQSHLMTKVLIKNELMLESTMRRHN